MANCDEQLSLASPASEIFKDNESNQEGNVHSEQEPIAVINAYAVTDADAYNLQSKVSKMNAGELYDFFLSEVGKQFNMGYCARTVILSITKNAGKYQSIPADDLWAVDLGTKLERQKKKKRCTKNGL